MLYRDDDVNKYTDVMLFLGIQSLFDKVGLLHTCAVEFESLWDSKGIWHILLLNPNIKVELHGWTHKDYSKLAYDEIITDFEMSLNHWYGFAKRGYGETVITPNKTITTYYPTWNRVSDDIYKACEKLGLKVDCRGNCDDVYHFHWWDAIFKDRAVNLALALGAGASPIVVPI